VAVLSAPVRPSLEPIAAFQQAMLVALLALAIVGMARGLAREPLVPSHVPRELASAADRISRGDFEVRVPRMSGTFGTLAAALSRASETARLARSASPLPAPTLDVPLHAVPPEETSGLAPPLTSAAVVLAAQASRAAHPRTTMPIEGDDEFDPSWRGVHEEFLRVRSAQGEPVDGVSWDRFRDKLRKNRDLLVQKYACRTVRFQVYVKEGKTALRATPVR
jgi:hypothetical protein